MIVRERRGRERKKERKRGRERKERGKVRKTERRECVFVAVREVMQKERRRNLREKERPKGGGTISFRCRLGPKLLFLELPLLPIFLKQHFRAKKINVERRLLSLLENSDDASGKNAKEMPILDCRCDYKVTYSRVVPKWNNFFHNSNKF